MPISVITGIHGFLGSHLSDSLRSFNHKVYAVDRETLENPIALKQELKELNPDYIFHFAAYGNHYNQNDIDEIIATNYLKTLFLLKATNDIPYKHFINISTSSVYGKKETPMKEDMSLDGDTFYSVTKMGAEGLCRAYAKQFDKKISTIRPFSVYGEGEAERRFIPTIIKTIKNKGTLNLDPSPTHDWIYVRDFIEGVITVMNRKTTNYDTFNIGTGEFFTNKQIVEMLEKIAGVKLKYNILENQRDYDQNIWVANTDKIRSLGWTPRTSIERGLTQTYEYYK